MVEEVLGWILPNINVELAIMMWKRAGKPLWLTLAAMEGMGGVTILVSYGSFGVLLWISRCILRPFHRFGFLQKGYGALRQSINLNSNIFFRRIKRYLGRHQQFLLFVANLIPVAFWGLFGVNLIPLPYFTLASVVVAKSAKIRYGLFCILAGNAIKIWIEVRLCYRFL